MSFTTILILVLLVLLVVTIAWIVISRFRYKKLDSQIDVYIAQIKSLQGQLEGLILQQHETKKIKEKQENGETNIYNLDNSKLSNTVDNLLSKLPRRNKSK